MVEQIPSAALALAFIGSVATALLVWLECAKQRVRRELRAMLRLDRAG